MAITEKDMKKWIDALKFVPVEGEADIYHKTYPQHDGYALRVDLSEKTIEYADASVVETSRITVWSKATSNFAKAENLVVLECVDRLLEKGYAPSRIELEKAYPSGKGRSGELDILVTDVGSQAFIMIECKTWGKEYDNEIKKMLADGGQLFAYFKNATSAKSLCLYTSCLSNGKIEYKNSLVDVAVDWKALSETKDIHERWNKTFNGNGIFEGYASLFSIVHKRLTYGDLVNVKDEDSRKIFHQIMTILRHNGVSDKPNAFNKLLNLFVCKIIDEDRNPDDELLFQCWEGLSDVKLQMTLNDLYKAGMWRFLNIRVIDHSESDVDKVLRDLGIGDTAHKQRLMDMFSDTRLKKSPSFAFIEVQDEKTFQLNAKIVREIVELLQQFRFRYEQKHEFLGDFFEKMLNTSMKQEAGQFFTPVPITRFIISSLPLREFVQGKISEQAPDPLPSVIDYACGSGHFLTEYMSVMQAIIETVDVSNTLPGTRNKLNSWRGDVKYSWADEYVYGIDFDNRLIKTAKVSAFFNGDGEATIIWGDGLDSFEHSDVYRGKLKVTMSNKQDNGQFDILISNPPYSVDAFRRMLRCGSESFGLYSGLTDNSSEIECLFVERMKQLLKVGGWAGVILPSSMLSNSGIYSRARDIIFKYFNVKAIVELGSGTFMETGTNTIVLFLERRPDGDHEIVSQAVNTFFKDKRDVAVCGVVRAFSTFVSNVYDDLAFADYVSFVNGNPNDKMKSHELFRDYLKEFGDAPHAKAFTVEKEKMLYFLLTHNQNIVIAKSGQKQEEKAFLGYEFRKRRGNEGISYLPGGTMLFDDKDMSNPQKINSHILNVFLGKSPLVVDDTIAKHLSYGRMSGFFEYGTSKFGKRVNLSKPIKRATKWKAYTLDELLRAGVFKQESGYAFPKNLQGNTSSTDIPFYKVSDMNEANYNGLMAQSVNYVSPDVLANDIKGRPFPEKAIIFPKVGQAIHTNKKRMLIREAVCDNNIMAIWIVDKQKWNDKYLFAYFNYFVKLSDYASSANPPSINIDRLSKLRIPCPPHNVQHQIVAEFDELEQNEAAALSLLSKSKQSIANIVQESGIPDTKLSSFTEYSTERIDAGLLKEENYVGVDNLLQEVEGKVDSSYVPTSGRVTAYHKGNILLSNIRPYLKKAWLADRGGGCSNDVLVICVDTSKALPKYVFSHLSTENFFAYEMDHIGSNVKMPRTDKTKVLEYRIPLPSLDTQKEIVAQIKQCELKAVKARELISELDKKRYSILTKYLQ